MTGLLAVLVMIGGGIGAVARHLIDLAVRSRSGSRFPWGTWWVNVVGSAVLGVVGGSAQAGRLGDAGVGFVGAGICGALTTFSTFGYQTLQLAEDGAVRAALLNVLVSVAAGLAACCLGWDLASRVLGG